MTGSGLNDALDFEILEASATRAVVALNVGPHHLQPFGLVHGGVYCALVETAGSIGSGYASPGGKIAVGVSNTTDFIRPVRGGRITATAVPVHVGRTQQLWDVDICDERDRLVARG